MHYVWKYFLDLNKKRTSNGFGMNPISWYDMHGYFELNHIVPLPEEIELINMLDEVMLEHYAKEAEKQQKKTKK